MKWFKLAVICVISIMVIPYASIKTLEMNGFCTKNYKFLSDVYTDQELIDKAILYYLELQSSTVYSFSSNEEKEVRQYINIEEFKNLNPNCCILNSGPDGRPASPWVLYGWVYFPYYTYYTNNSPPSKGIKYIGYNSCGEMKEYHD